MNAGGDLPRRREAGVTKTQQAIDKKKKQV